MRPPFEPADRNVDRRAFDLRGPAGHVAEVVARAGHVDDAGHLLRLAVVDALELRELVGVLVDEIGEPPDQRLALRRQHRRPRAALERLARGGDGFVDVGAARVGDRRDFVARRGIDDGNAIVRGRTAPTRRRSAASPAAAERLRRRPTALAGQQSRDSCNSPISVVMSANRSFTECRTRLAVPARRVHRVRSARKP